MQRPLASFPEIFLHDEIRNELSLNLVYTMTLCDIGVYEIPRVSSDMWDPVHTLKKSWTEEFQSVSLTSHNQTKVWQGIIFRVFSSIRLHDYDFRTL